MRKAFDPQGRLDCPAVDQVKLNFNCRSEIIPILRTLQYVYSQPRLLNTILRLVAADVNQESDPRRGREGLDYWAILVLAAVRLGCKFDYDQLQDLAETTASSGRSWASDSGRTRRNRSTGGESTIMSACSSRRRSRRSTI